MVKDEEKGELGAVRKKSVVMGGGRSRKGGG